MKTITKIISLITGSSIAASSFFAGCTDYYGPAPVNLEYEANLCCHDAANYEQCVKAFKDTGECEPDNDKS